jgi:hypothetical protein
MHKPLYIFVRYLVRAISITSDGTRVYVKYMSITLRVYYTFKFRTCSTIKMPQITFLGLACFACYFGINMCHLSVRKKSLWDNKAAYKHSFFLFFWVMQMFQPSAVLSVEMGQASRKYRALCLIGSVFCHDWLSFLSLVGQYIIPKSKCHVLSYIVLSFWFPFCSFSPCWSY